MNYDPKTHRPVVRWYGNQTQTNYVLRRPDEGPVAGMPYNKVTGEQATGFRYNPLTKNFQAAWGDGRRMSYGDLSTFAFNKPSSLITQPTQPKPTPPKTILLNQRIHSPRYFSSGYRPPTMNQQPRVGQSFVRRGSW